MNFIYKCYLQKLFSSIPKGERLNYLFQKHITHNLPANDATFVKKMSVAKEHFDTFARYTKAADIKNINYYEFGAGWDLNKPNRSQFVGDQKIMLYRYPRTCLPGVNKRHNFKVVQFESKYSIRLFSSGRDTTGSKTQFQRHPNDILWY